MDERQSASGRIVRINGSGELRRTLDTTIVFNPFRCQGQCIVMFPSPRDGIKRLFLFHERRQGGFRQAILRNRAESSSSW